MSAKAEWPPSVLKSIKRETKKQKQRLFDALDKFATSGEGDVKRLQGEEDGLFRLRVGDWRIIFEIDGDVMRVVRVGPRGDIY